MSTATPAAIATLEAPPVASISTPTGQSTPEVAPNAPATGDSGSFGESLDAFFANELNDLTQTPQLDTPDTPPVVDKAGETPTDTPPVVDKADADPLDEVDADKSWTPQAARRFKEIKAEAKAAKARTAELEASLTQREARLKELEALAEDPRVKDMTSRAEEYEHATILRNLESSNAYKQLVGEPLARMVGEIDGLAEKYSVDSDSLIDVVVMEDEAAQEERLGEMLAAASDRDKFRLYKIIEDVKPVLEQRRVLQENAQEALREAEDLERQKTQASLADRAQTRLTAAKEVAKRIESKLPFLQSFEGVDLAKLTDEAAATDYSSLTPAAGAYNAMAGRLLPKMATEYLAARREIEALTEQLAEYDKAGAPLNGGAARAGGGSMADDNRGFVDAIEAAFGGR